MPARSWWQWTSSSIDQIPLLPPAAELDSATAANSTLPIVETVPGDDSVLADDVTCATSADTAFMITYRCIVWDIRVVNSHRYVPDASPIQTLTSTLIRLVSVLCTKWR